MRVILTDHTQPIIEARTCVDCGRRFVIRAGAAQYFATIGLSLPRRCGRCREARRPPVPDTLVWTPPD